MNTLEIYSEIVNWSVLVFILTRVINTDCFNKLDWGLTAVALLFSYFVRYISEYPMKEQEK